MFQVPPGPLSPKTAALLTQLLTRLEGLTNIKGVAPITVQQSNSGPPIISSTAAPRKLLQLLGHEPFGEYDSAHPDGPPGYNPDSSDEYDVYPDCKYSWVEVDFDPATCSYVPITNAARGYVDQYPAVAIDGSSEIGDGTVVEAWLAPSGSHWRFSPGGSLGSGVPIEIVTCVSLVDEDSL